MSIDGALAKWAKTAAGKAKLEKAQKNALKNGGRGRSGVKGPEFYAEKLIDILRVEIALCGFEYGDYLYWTDVGYNDAMGKYEIHVNFKHEELDRPSLWPDGYPDGVENIAALMNTGYHAKDYVYGTYPTGRRGRSMKDRTGVYFIQAAVARFNSMYGANAIADYSDEYGS